ncbi:rRNA-processing protein fcf2 [Eutrema salsugineum]|uniref:rRNA-processing protein fcf2 n=1 Tax=Eutrema salsugineum TaxID=72664 RepID=UPI000CED7D22|nr:rRNA-processing protein fcf2 [Eutrema salsugineum]XP_024006978.1 rRNA-processing protein fcf2 [Eutrema salsugineum]
MAEIKPLIGLKWEPKLPGLSLDSKTGSSSSKVAEQRHESGSLWTSNSELVDGLCLPPTDPRKINKMSRKNLKDSAGPDWYDMPAPTMTPELKRDLQMLKLRNVLDPSQHYKRVVSRSKLAEKYFQVGTVIEPSQEFYGRLTKKNRKSTLADELVSDPKTAQYRKRKVREIEEKNRDVQNKKWKRKGKDSKSAKHRRN